MHLDKAYGNVLSVNMFSYNNSEMDKRRAGPVGGGHSVHPVHAARIHSVVQQSSQQPTSRKFT